MLGMIVEKVQANDDEDDIAAEPITYGPMIDTILSLLLPYAMMFFNTTSKRVKANAALIADHLNSGTNRYHFMPDDSTLDDGAGKIVKVRALLNVESLYTPANPESESYADFLGGLDVSIKIVRLGNVTHHYIYNTETIVAVINQVIAKYLSEEWNIINVAPFFDHLSEFTQPTVEADINDI